MMFSLILATLGRSDELSRFLIHLNEQSFREFELIIIDQNTDERLIPILAEYNDKFRIIHIKTSPGLSRARNIGLLKATGDIICFPDDDCWYPYNLLESVYNFLSENPEIDGVTGRTVDENGLPSLNRWSDNSGFITLYQPWTRVTSPAIFIKKVVTVHVGFFDETLGVGSGTPWGSGEEVDYIFRSIKEGFGIWYNYDLVVGHPNPIMTLDKNALRRGYQYAMGFGRVQRKHNFPLSQVLYYWLRSLFGAILALITGNFKKSLFHLYVLKGRIKGWLFCS